MRVAVAFIFTYELFVVISTKKLLIAANFGYILGNKVLTGQLYENLTGYSNDFY